MPRKQNGWGEKAVRGFKKFDGNPRVKKAAGSYPSRRTFGSTVTRTVIEDWNAKSPWVRWRKGMEYYFQAAYLEWQKVTATLFQGTNDEIEVEFDGYRFATKNADSRTHYAIRRKMDSNKLLGRVIEVRNNPYQYKENQQNHELWIRVEGRPAIEDGGTLLQRSIGERIKAGMAAAVIKNVLTKEELPAVYTGKSFRDSIALDVSVPLDLVENSTYVQENGGIQSLVGQVVYIPKFYQETPITLFDLFIDGTEYFSVQMTEFDAGEDVIILENNTELPPTLGNIEKLTPIVTTKDSSSRLNGEFFFRKSDYQRFFGNTYLTAEVVQQQVDRAAYAIMPQTILSVRADESTNSLLIQTIPFQAQLTLFTPQDLERYLILDDRGITKQYPDYKDGVYQHSALAPGEEPWQTLELDVDAWMDETFLVGYYVKFDDLYVCSCPDYLHAKIRSPETLDSEGRRLNRQTRVPLPSAKGSNTYDLAGQLQVAGIASSWATEDYKRSFKICKHTIASMFINKIRVQEPSQVPSSESREAFEPKLAADIQEVSKEFDEMIKRSEITTVEIVFALAEALNLDDVEIGYVLQTASF